MSSDLRIGIIGSGGISHAHIQSYQLNKGAKVVSVVDVDAERAKSVGEKYGAKWYTDVDEMLDRENLNAVSICTPPFNHHEMVKKVAERKIHIMCEKPLTINSKFGEEMVKVARKNKVLLLVAMCHKFHEPLARLKAAIDEGKIGKIVSYRNRFHWVYERANDIAKVRGGVLLDNGSHSIYIFRHLVGDVKKVSASVKFNKGSKKEITDLRSCFVTFESVNGAVGYIELEGLSPGGNNHEAIIEVYGDKGAGVIDYCAKSFYKSVDSKDVVNLDPEGEYPSRFVKEIEHFLNCINGKEKPTIDVTEGFKDVKIAEAIYKAGKEGKVITLK